VAGARPATTFHLAPLIVAAWPAFGEGRLEQSMLLSLSGGLIAIATAGLLSLAGLLQGPSLLPWGGPALGSLLVVAVGMLAGIAPSVLSRLAARQR
jgi:hypothetical protein